MTFLSCEQTWTCLFEFVEKNPLLQSTVESLAGSFLTVESWSRFRGVVDSWSRGVDFENVHFSKNYNMNKFHVILVTDRFHDS